MNTYFEFITETELISYGTLDKKKIFCSKQSHKRTYNIIESLSM
jgi:hypothetical protein